MASTTMKAGPRWAILLALLLPLLSSQVYGHGGGDDTDSGDQPVNLRAKGLVAVKIWCLVILLVSTFAGGVSPYFFRWNESFLLMGTQFAGGVFLGTSLMHFLADASSTFMDRTSNPYPFAFMLASAGYLLTMLGDCIIVTLTRGGTKEAKVEAERGGDSDGHRNEDDPHLHPSFLRTTSFGDTLLLILALCFHSVFEGIAIGVSGWWHLLPQHGNSIHPLTSNAVLHLLLQTQRAAHGGTCGRSVCIRSSPLSPWELHC